MKRTLKIFHWKKSSMMSRQKNGMTLLAKETGKVCRTMPSGSFILNVKQHLKKSGDCTVASKLPTPISNEGVIWVPPGHSTGSAPGAGFTDTISTCCLLMGGSFCFLSFYYNIFCSIRRLRRWGLTVSVKSLVFH